MRIPLDAAAYDAVREWLAGRCDSALARVGLVRPADVSNCTDEAWHKYARASSEYQDAVNLYRDFRADFGPVAEVRP